MSRKPLLSASASLNRRIASALSAHASVTAGGGAGVRLQPPRVCLPPPADVLAAATLTPTGTLPPPADVLAAATLTPSGTLPPPADVLAAAMLTPIGMHWCSAAAGVFLRPPAACLEHATWTRALRCLAAARVSLQGRRPLRGDERAGHGATEWTSKATPLPPLRRPWPPPLLSSPPRALPSSLQAAPATWPPHPPHASALPPLAPPPRRGDRPNLNGATERAAMAAALPPGPAVPQRQAS
eukprot:7387660-Prymnesium_polylepis.1